MKIEDIKIEQNRIKTNKTKSYGVYVDFEIDVKDCEDYAGKNPTWAIFYIERNEKPYKVRWLDYDGWREVGDDSDTFDNFENAAQYLRAQISQEKALISRGGIVRHAEEYTK